jgi:hypothetical protein
MKKFYPIPGHQRYEISEDGTIRNCLNGKIKSQYIGSTGYYMVSFSYGNKSNPQRVHRLLASCFIPNPDNLPHINHIDGNKTNNSLGNLQWVTHEGNMKHAFSTGLANNSGEKNGQAKLSAGKVSEIKQLLLTGMSQQKIAKRFGVSRSCIQGIKERRLWASM